MGNFVFGFVWSHQRRIQIFTFFKIDLLFDFDSPFGAIEPLHKALQIQSNNIHQHVKTFKSPTPCFSSNSISKRQLPLVR